MKDKVVGILGGLGPKATVDFQKLLYEKSKGDKDQDFLDTIAFNHSTIPDRTEFILGRSKEDPTPYLIEDAKKLEKMGADILVMPCNTAHYFYEEIKKNISIEFIDIVQVTVKKISELGIKRVCLFATDGTIKAGRYAKYAEDYGIELIYPKEKDQKKLMSIIYDYVKAMKQIDPQMYYDIEDNIREDKAEAIILGCTELSGLKEVYHKIALIDSLEVLAENAIILGGKEVKK